MVLETVAVDVAVIVFDPVAIIPLVNVRTALKVTEPVNVLTDPPEILRLLNVNAGIFWVVPLKFTVLPVIVNVLVPGSNVPAIPTMPLLGKTLAPEPELVRL